MTQQFNKKLHFTKPKQKAGSYLAFFLLNNIKIP